MSLSFSLRPALNELVTDISHLVGIKQKNLPFEANFFAEVYPGQAYRSTLS